MYFPPLLGQCDCIVLRDRKLNIAPAIKKQTLCATNGAVYYAATPPTPAINNIPIEQFATVYPPGVPTMYPPTLPYQPFYQYYSVPMVSVQREQEEQMPFLHFHRQEAVCQGDMNPSFRPSRVRCISVGLYYVFLFLSFLSPPLVPNAFPPQNVPTIWPQNYQGKLS